MSNRRASSQHLDRLVGEILRKIATIAGEERPITVASLLSTPKTCQLCGASFACGAPCHCWCDHVPLDAPNRAGLQRSFSDCLCSACLEAAAARRSLPHRRSLLRRADATRCHNGTVNDSHEGHEEHEDVVIVVAFVATCRRALSGDVRWSRTRAALSEARRLARPEEARGFRNLLLLDRPSNSAETSMLIKSPSLSTLLSDGMP